MMKIGDDIHNSDRCGSGMKFNMRLGRCVPTNAFVDQQGIVNMTHTSSSLEAAIGTEPPSVEKNPNPKPAPKPTPEQAVKAEGAKRVKAKAVKQARS